jgi:hypothetical protein
MSGSCLTFDRGDQQSDRRLQGGEFSFGAIDPCDQAPVLSLTLIRRRQRALRGRTKFSAPVKYL